MQAKPQYRTIICLECVPIDHRQWEDFAGLSMFQSIAERNFGVYGREKAGNLLSVRFRVGDNAFGLFIRHLDNKRFQAGSLITFGCRTMHRIIAQGTSFIDRHENIHVALRSSLRRLLRRHGPS